MIDLRALLRDRRRAQRGSVLSGVLIMVAFLAILSGALLTELSTNFLLSTAIVDRVTQEATVDSSMELAIAQLQDTRTTPLFNGCPGSVTWPANGTTAVASDASCYPVIDAASPQMLAPIVSSSQFMADEIHAVLAGAGVDEYLTGDADGNLFAFSAGSSSPAWSYALGGEVVGTPLVMPDVSDLPDGVLYVVPATNPNGGQAAGCAVHCVALLSASGAGKPSPVCLMPATGTVSSQPAAGSAISGVAYFGDSAGNLYAYQATSASQPGPACGLEDSLPISTDVPGTGGVVAGPFVIRSSSGKATDHIFAVVSSGSTGYLVQYTFSVTGGAGSFKFAGALALPGVGAGAALEQATSLLAIAFTNGRVAVVQITANFSMSLAATRQLAGGIADGPTWASSGALGVAAGSTLYVLSAGLNVISTFVAPSGIVTSPSADNGGDWFFGTNAGMLYEAGTVTGSTAMAQDFAYGGSGAVTSAPVAVPCAIGVCIYLGSSDGNVYFAGLDARDAVLDSCITSCAAGHFSLRAGVEVGSAGSPGTVHVQSWSYYSP